MNEPVSAQGARHTARNDEDTGTRRTDRTMFVPLSRLFYPDPDPTDKYPDEVAEIDGYVVAPDRTTTFATTILTEGGFDMLDSVWTALQRKGVGRRRMLVLDDRGRTVSVMTLKLDAPKDLLRLLRSLLVVPVRAHLGFAEIHFFATSDEVSAIEETVEKGRHPVPPSPTVFLAPAKDTGPLLPEDWAFLGFLSAVGAFNGPEGLSPTLFAEMVGIDLAAFAKQARSIERNMGMLVKDMFAPIQSGEESNVAVA